MMISRMFSRVAHMLLAAALFTSAQAYADAQMYYVHTDQLGTPQVLTDQSQKVVWKVSQTPFGEVTASGSVEQPYRFPGQYADPETGYSYNYYRDYDPSLGRYLQSDPIGLAGGLNTYSYAGQNPLSHVDPYGLDFADAITIAPSALLTAMLDTPAPGPADAAAVAMIIGALMIPGDAAQYAVRPSNMTKDEESKFDIICKNAEDPCDELKKKVKEAINAARVKVEDMLVDKNSLFGQPGWGTHTAGLAGRIKQINVMISLGIKMGCDMSQEIIDAATLYIPSAPR